jgi:hypothetical protein
LPDLLLLVLYIIRKSIGGEERRIRRLRKRNRNRTASRRRFRAFFATGRLIES